MTTSAAASVPALPRPRRSLPGALRAGLLALVALLAAPAPRAGAVETRGLGITPAHEADYFHLSLLPGQATANTAVVTNFSDEPARLRLYAVDAEVTPQGQFALRGESEPRETVGRWLVPSVDRLTLAPRASARVDFALAVPEGTASRDYAGGIVIEGEPRPGAVQTVGKDTAFQLNVVERLGVRVYLKVEGEAHPHLGAGPLRWERGPGGAIEFSLRLRNDGNVRLTPRAAVTLHGLGLSGRSVELGRPELLLPGTAAVLRGRWADPPLYAMGRAEALVAYGDGRVARASTGVRLVPLLPTALGALFGAGLVYLAYRFGRFLRRARVALRLAAMSQPPEAPHAP